MDRLSLPLKPDDRVIVRNRHRGTVIEAIYGTTNGTVKVLHDNGLERTWYLGEVERGLGFDAGEVIERTWCPYCDAEYGAPCVVVLVEEPIRTGPAMYYPHPERVAKWESFDPTE